jgi:predicted nucleic acid-binding protein
VAAASAVIVVDTTVWADWFNGAGSPEVARLDRALEQQDAGLVPVVLTEVLQGFRIDRDFERACELLVQLPLLALDADGHVAAARLFRRLRRRGITVRGAIDCLIAQTCIAAGVELLSTDQDFAAIARHTPLRLCSV